MTFNGCFFSCYCKIRNIITEKATRRTIALLNRVTTVKGKGGGINQRLNGPEFCYCFPLIRSALIHAMPNSEDPLITLGLQVMSEHAQIRSTGNTLDLFHPRLLPSKQMFDLLIDLISKLFLLG